MRVRVRARVMEEMRQQRSPEAEGFPTALTTSPQPFSFAEMLFSRGAADFVPLHTVSGRQSLRGVASSRLWPASRSVRQHRLCSTVITPRSSSLPSVRSVPSVRCTHVQGTRVSYAQRHTSICVDFLLSTCTWTPGSFVTAGTLIIGRYCASAFASDCCRREWDFF